MKKFEYKLIEDVDVVEKPFMETLNEYGLDGWQLVNTVVNGPYLTILLMREIV